MTSPASTQDISSPQTLSVDIAKKYLDSVLNLKNNLLQSMSLNASGSTTSDAYFMFNRAKIGGIRNLDMVEIPVALSNKSISLYNFSKDSVKFKPDVSVFKASFTRAIIYRSRTTKILKSVFVTYIPDKEYLLANKNDASSNSIAQMNPLFKGYLQYQDKDGNIKYVLRIVNGHVIRKYIYSPSGRIQIQNTKLKVMDWVEQCTDHWQVGCQRGPEGELINCGDPVYLGYDCNIYYEPDNNDNNNNNNDDGDDPDPDSSGYNDNGNNCSSCATPEDDLCDNLKLGSANKANAMRTGNSQANNSTITSAFTAAKNSSANGQEAAFHIDGTDGAYSASTPVASTEGDTYSSTNVNANTAAIGHAHDINHSPVPSFFDAYSIGELDYTTHGKTNIDFTLSATNSYALVVYNKDIFNDFLSHYGESNLEKDSNGNYTGDLDPSSTIGAAIAQVKTYSIALYNQKNSVDPQNPTSAELDAARLAGYETALTYFCDHYTTGITVLKADANGSFQPLHFATYTSSQSQVVIYLAKPCN